MLNKTNRKRKEEHEKSEYGLYLYTKKYLFIVTW